LANGKTPPVFPISEKLLLNAEGLSDARTLLADCLSILLGLPRSGRFIDSWGSPNVE